jgi:hypothetical protein
MSNSTSESSVSSSEVTVQTSRILSSSVFCESPTLQRLFTYLVDQALDGHVGNLKEYSIGAEVFQRGAGFDPRTDSIVRVQMGVLRKKLAAYYEGPGKNDELMIEIPRGHYAPHFVPRIVQPTAPEILIEPIEPAPVAPRRPFSLWLVAAGIALGMAAVYAIDRSPVASPSPQKATVESEWRNHPLWAGFVGPNANTKLVIGAPMIVEFGLGLLIRDTSVNRPEDIEASERIRRFEQQNNVKGTSTELYTGLGEAAGISLLDRFFHASGQDLPLIRNRLTKWQDLTASNVIFLSSMRFRTLGQELKRPSEFEFVPVSPGGNVVRNLKPRNGEKEFYQVSMRDSGTGIDYALITVWPGTSPGRRIMAVGGSHTWGTEGAVMYITDPEALRELGRKVELPDNLPGPVTLQVLLKIEMKDAQVISTDYITHHWIR